MPRGRILLFGAVIALVSIALTALALLVVAPIVLPGASRGAGDQPGRVGEAREVVFNPDDRLQVIVALQKLPRGFTIPTDAYNNAVGMREWPAASVPVDAIVVQPGQDPEAVVREQVVGRIARTDIEREQPLLRAALVENLTELARTGSDIGALLPPGMEAVALPVDRRSSVGYSVRAGDHLDLIFTFTVLDVDEEFQSALPNWVYQVQYGIFTEDGARVTAIVTPQDAAVLGRIDTIPPGELANVVPSEPQRPRTVSQRVILDAVVLYVGEAPAEGDLFGVPPAERSADTVPAGRPEVLILGVTPQDAVVLTWAVVSGVDINAAIRSVQDAPNQATSSVTLQYVFETSSVQVPPRLPYSLEPSLREAPGMEQVAPADE